MCFSVFTAARQETDRINPPGIQVHLSEGVFKMLGSGLGRERKLWSSGDTAAFLEPCKPLVRREDGLQLKMPIKRVLRAVPAETERGAVGVTEVLEAVAEQSWCVYIRGSAGRPL